MSRPVPIVPEVLLLGTLPNPGDLERSIRLQLTPGSRPAPEMAMAAAGAPGRAGRLRGPGGRLRGSGLDIGGGLVVSDPSTGLSADVRVRVRVRMLLAKPPGSGNEGVSVSLSYSDARSTQPSPHGLAAGGGLADAPSAPPAQPPSDHGVEPVALEGDLVGLSLLPRQRSQDLNVPAAVTARGLEKSSRVARESQHRGSPCDGAAGVVVNGHGIDYGVGWERDEAGFVHGAGDSWECAGLFEDRDRARDRELCPSLHHGYLHGSAQTHHRGCDRQWSTIGSRDIRNLRLR